MTRTDLSCDRDGFVALERGEARANGGHTDSAGAERVVSNGEEQRTVDPAE